MNRERSPGPLRRTWQSVQWLFPAGLLVLTPKCPLCVAAYVALFTGIGISVSAGRWIQILIVGFSLSLLGALTYFKLKTPRPKSNAP